MRIAPAIELSDDERRTLERWSHSRAIPFRQVQRAKIILAAVSGMESKEIARQLETSEATVGRCRSRFASGRTKGIERDKPRSGRRATRRRQYEGRIIQKTTQELPKNATHWSTRTMARELHISQSMVTRVWRANGLKPHLVRTFKVSNDPRFEEKLLDVVGLYLNPPEHALVLCADEKTQVQALDRTQKSLPIVKGRCGTMTHDYSRHGTTTLFAAIDMTEGKVIGTCMPRHRHQEWIKFLTLIDERTPQDLDLHLIVDNLATHKHAKVKSWLKRHPRVHAHFIPTSSSWLNLVERFFRDLDQKRLRRGVFSNVPKLIDAISSYIKSHNDDPKPFVWTAKAEDIIAKVGRARLALKNNQRSD